MLRLLAPLALAAAGLLLTACPGEELPEALGDCPDGSTIAWADASAALETNCVRCHDSGKSGAERQAAPEGVDYDGRENAMAFPDLTWARIADGSMPNDADYSGDATVLWEWYSCGTPE